MSVALANYAASGLDEKTAYVELSGHGELKNWKEAGIAGYFSDQEVCFYPDFSREKIPLLLNYGYETVILDFGEAYESYREEILRCHRKIFLLNLNPWQKSAAEKMVDTVQGENWGNIHPYYASVHAGTTEKKAVETEFGIHIDEIPVIQNPRCVEAELFSCMNQILDRRDFATAKKKRLIPIKRKR